MIVESNELKLDPCMDSDDLGNRLVSLFKELDTRNNVINLIKIRGLDRKDADHVCLYLNKCLKEMGADNCLLVPLNNKTNIEVQYILK